jgi:hypothetical protein
MADKPFVKPKEVRSDKSVPHRCERRAHKRLLCSDLVQLLWMGPDGLSRREIAILENLSDAGAGLFMGVPIAHGTEAQIIANDTHLTGQIRQCTFRGNGYIVGMELASQSRWAQAAGRFLPEHLLDVSLLDLD